MLAREQPAPSAASVVAGICAQSPGVAEQQADPAMAEAGLSGMGVDAKADAASAAILRGADVLGSSYEIAQPVVSRRMGAHRRAAVGLPPPTPAAQM